MTHNVKLSFFDHYGQHSSLISFQLYAKIMRRQAQLCEGTNIDDLVRP